MSSKVVKEEKGSKFSVLAVKVVNGGDFGFFFTAAFGGEFLGENHELKRKWKKLKYSLSFT